MFESIKLKVIKGRQLNPFATAKVLQDHEDRLKALEGGDSTEESTTRNVSFTINDGTDAIGGATVVIDNDTSNAKTSGSAGGCSASLTEGTHTVKVTKEGFDDKTETITVSESNTAFTISLTESS